MKETGRNDPCLCGSGRKYKYCCLRRQGLGGDSGPGAPPPGSGPGFGGPPLDFGIPPPGLGSPGEKGIADSILQEFLAESETPFDSLEEAQDRLQAFIERKNEKADPDFHGLSPTEVRDIIHYPFDSPDTLCFRDRLTREPDAEIITILDEIGKAIEKPGGLKTTKTGALPRAFAQFMEPVLAPYTRDPDRLLYMKVNKEADLFELHTGRVILKVAGLLRVYKGKFILSRNCRSLLKQGQFASVYPVLFRSTAIRFNWCYWDYNPAATGVQAFFAFGLYLLAKYGREARPAEFYAEAFLNAFPMLVQEIPPSSYGKDPVEEFMDIFIYRVIRRFWGFFGLASITTKRRQPYGFAHTVEATPLLDDVVSFRVLND